MTTKRAAEIVNRNWFVLDGMVYWDDGEGLYLRVPEHSFPRINKETFDKKFKEACTVIQRSEVSS